MKKLKNKELGVSKKKKKAAEMQVRPLASISGSGI